MDYEKLPPDPVDEDELSSPIPRSRWQYLLPKALAMSMSFIAGLVLGLTTAIFIYSTRHHTFCLSGATYDTTPQFLTLPRNSRAFNLSDFNFASPQPDETTIWKSSVPSEMFLYVDDPSSAGLPPGIPLATVKNDFTKMSSARASHSLLHEHPGSTLSDPELTNFYVPSVLHQLHCVAWLRQAYIEAAYEGTIAPYEHVSHCFEFVREAIKCAGDVTLEGHDEGMFSVAGGRAAMHSCLDIEKLLEMMRQGEGKVEYEVAHV
ncbi:hypothetical protein PV04_05364 [Phialophora macrospora]|uniref:Uncharacterized protein n=1 Tax=Phialophora macrospora TaxID=1851006 RepID=A0A0D2CWH1_9EURO|nr:hypothetical protein PV04_05364 [Phialophora macrospora]